MTFTIERTLTWTIILLWYHLTCIFFFNQLVNSPTSIW